MTVSLFHYKLAAIYIILCSMYTNICHNVCDPKGSCPVKLILNNCVYTDELCVVKEDMTKYTPERTCEVSTKLMKHTIEENT
jgi:hypothetical protein